MFADKVEITVKAGRGGDGRLSFRHEKFRAKGGPDGGDGGRGGNVVFEVDHNLNTLAAFRRKRLIKAENGQPGGSDRKHGKSGEDVVVKVPAGTQVYEGEELRADLTDQGQRQVVAKGGHGGFGNAHFVSSTRQAPRAAELGEPGEQHDITLELKLVADVGLVGLPNAGKSTLLSVISNAKPEIGDYPFTTLTPNLGVVDFEGTTFLVADIPGLIEGASQGKGLGDEFLRHIERTAVLVHLVDAYSDSLSEDYQTIQKELAEYGSDLTQKPQLVALTKIEGIEADNLKAKQQELQNAAKQPVFPISSVAHKGVNELLRAALPLIQEARRARAEAVKEQEAVVIDEASQPELWSVAKEKGIYVVRGQAIERFAIRTDWNNEASVERLRDILDKRGVVKELTKLGLEPGAEVEIAGHRFTW